MLGSLFSSVLKLGTLPLDAASIGLDMLAGGDGSKASRTDGYNPLGLLEELRDQIAEAAEDCDE